MDTNQLRGDEEQIMKAKQGKIFGISWKRYRDEAMKPEKGQESIIVSALYVKCDQICLACSERLRKDSTQKVYGQ